MDHDGVPEIVVGRVILDPTGAILGVGAHGFGSNGLGNLPTTTVVVDLDQDGQDEVVVGNAAYRKDGSAIWANGLPDGLPGVGDFDGDGLGEVVVTSHQELRMIDTDGTPLWKVALDHAENPWDGSPPTVADLDGDTVPEILVATEWVLTAYDAAGAVRWVVEANDPNSGMTPPVVYDLDGDGTLEVMHVGESDLWIRDAATGNLEFHTDQHSTATWVEYPVVADVDLDGGVDLVTVRDPHFGPSKDVAVLSSPTDGWRPGGVVWTQHGWYPGVTDEDGRVPLVGPTPWLDGGVYRGEPAEVVTERPVPDLALRDAGLCLLECSEGELVVQVQVGNEGELPLVDEGLTVELVAVSDGVETVLDTEDIVPYVFAGQFADALVFEVSGDFQTVDELVARIVGERSSCSPEDEEVRWAGPFCVPDGR